MNSSEANDGKQGHRPLSSKRVGMVGAGQLARMTYQAGIALGLTVRLLAERADDSASLVGADITLGSPLALTDLRRFAGGCDVITFDHELVDAAALAEVERSGCPVWPSSAVVALAQNKLDQRRKMAALGFPVPPFCHVETPDAVAAFAALHGWPVILKAAHGGYDGRGVWQAADVAAAATVLEQAARRGLTIIAEQQVAIERELAVLVARRPSGATAVYPVVETVQLGGICREVLAPASVPSPVAEEAQRLAVALTTAVGAVGIFAVELFQSSEGLSINEVAARLHNSGHYTIEGCVTSQFENHLRAILDWPLGAPTMAAPAVATVNVLGGAAGLDPNQHLALALGVPGVHVHLYGKAARPGRKLGHVTVTGASLPDVRHRAQLAAQLLATGKADKEQA